MSEPLANGKSIACEMNKFDETMGYLAAKSPSFKQIVAVDASFDLFTRAWCVSELAKAHALGMKQELKLLNVRALESHSERLSNLRIEHMKASRPEDITESLAGIPDKESFNKTLQELLFAG